jgi:drug/metabolite transporter (DMT)-like permease
VTTTLPSTRSPIRGRTYALLAAVCFGANGSMSKLVLQSGMPPERLTALRATGAAIVLLALVAVTRPGALRITRRELPTLVLCGLAGVALVQYLYVVAIGRLPVGVALLIEFTAPVLVALWTRFGFPARARRPVHNRVWTALALVVVGMAVLAQVWDGLTLDGIGLLAAAGSAGALAAFFLLSEHGVVDRDGLSFAALVFAVGAITWSVVRPWWTFPVDLLAGTSDPHGVPIWLLCIGVVLIGTVASYLLTFAALRHLSATDASVVGTAEPLLAGLVAWIVLSEVLTLAQAIGGAIVLGGILLAQSAPPGGAVAPAATALEGLAEGPAGDDREPAATPSP